MTDTVSAARSRRSPKKDSKPISKGPGLSESEQINIVMNGLNGLQERFGKLYFVPPTDQGDPALLVLPKTLSVCEDCGTIIVAGSKTCRFCTSKHVTPVTEKVA